MMLYSYVDGAFQWYNHRPNGPKLTNKTIGWQRASRLPVRLAILSTLVNIFWFAWTVEQHLFRTGLLVTPRLLDRNLFMTCLTYRLWRLALLFFWILDHRLDHEKNKFWATGCRATFEQPFHTFAIFRVRKTTLQKRRKTHHLKIIFSPFVIEHFLSYPNVVLLTYRIKRA